MMQHDTNNMDKNLRQLENQSLPDLSKMDEHWAQMKATLVPRVQPGTTGSLFTKTGFYLIGAAITGILVFTLVLFNKKTSPDTVIANNPPPADTPRITKADVIINKKDIIIKAPVIKIISPDSKPKTQQLLIINPSIKDTPKSKLQIISYTDYSAELEAFYRKVEKEYQQFVIHPLQDTVIYGKDG